MNEEVFISTIIEYFWITLLVFAVVVAIVLVIEYIIRIYTKKQYEIVKRISEKAKQVRILNSRYNFYTLYNNERVIYHKTNSKRSYDRTNCNDIILVHLENNYNSLMTDLKMAYKNFLIYKDYTRDFNNINVATSDELLEKEKISRKKFNKYEEKYIKEIKVTDPHFIEVDMEIYYVSPRGRNHYTKNTTYTLFTLSHLAKQITEKKKYQSNAAYERSLMTESMRYDILKRDGFRCQICGASAQDGATLHVDHIIPVAKGGKTIKKNLQTLCNRCNSGKSDKM